MKIFVVFLVLTLYWLPLNASPTLKLEKEFYSECQLPYFSPEQYHTIRHIRYFTPWFIDIRCKDDGYHVFNSPSNKYPENTIALYCVNGQFTNVPSGGIYCLPECKNTTDHMSELTRHDEVDVTRDIDGDGQPDIRLKSCSNVDGEASNTTFWPCNKNGVWPLSLTDYHLQTTFNNPNVTTCQTHAPNNVRAIKSLYFTPETSLSGHCMPIMEWLMCDHKMSECTEARKDYGQWITFNTPTKEYKYMNRRIREGETAEFHNVFITCAKHSDGTLQLKITGPPEKNNPTTCFAAYKEGRNKHSTVVKINETTLEDYNKNSKQLNWRPHEKLVPGFGRWFCMRDKPTFGKLQLRQYVPPTEAS